MPGCLNDAEKNLGRAGSKICKMAYWSNVKAKMKAKRVDKGKGKKKDTTSTWNHIFNSRPVKLYYLYTLLSPFLSLQSASMTVFILKKNDKFSNKDEYSSSVRRPHFCHLQIYNSVT